MRVCARTFLGAAALGDWLEGTAAPALHHTACLLGDTYTVGRQAATFVTCVRVKTGGNADPKKGQAPPCEKPSRKKTLPFVINANPKAARPCYK
jgi:hypothetical protein